MNAPATPATRPTPTMSVVSRQPLASYRLSNLNTDDTRSIAFSPDGRILASSSILADSHIVATVSSDQALTLWKVGYVTMKQATCVSVCTKKGKHL